MSYACRTFNQSESFELILDTVKKQPTDLQELSPEHQVVKRIKNAHDTLDLLDLMSKMDKNDLEAHHLSQAFNRLFMLQKVGYNSIPPSQLVDHNGFDNMCHLLKFKAPRMDSSGLISSLKVLVYFGLKTESLIVQRVLQLIKNQINDLTLNELLFLSFLLKNIDTTPLTEALLIAIPLVFDLNLNLKLDHNNSTELTELFHYTVSTKIKLSNKSVTSIITALTLHGHQLKLNEARSIIWSLTSTPDFSPSYEKLLHNCLTILNSNYLSMTFDDMEMTLTKLCIKYFQGERLFYNEEFFNNCAKYVIEKGSGNLRASYILKKFNKLCFVNFDLLDYIDKTIVDNHSLLSTSKLTGLLTLSSGFSNANYKSENWEIIKSLLHENPLLHNETATLPGLRFAIDMMALDFHSNILFEKIFSTKYIEEIVKQDNLLNHIQLLLLWQSVKLILPDYNGPLPDQRFIEDAILLNVSKSVQERSLNTLADIFGGHEFVQTNVLSSYGHCLDFVIAFDDNENPIAMPCRIKKFDEFPKSQVRPVVVFFNSRACFSINYPQRFRGIIELKKRTLDALGIRSVNVSTVLLDSLLDNERQDYIEREIRYALR